MRGKLTVLVGGQYGSEGKGAIAAFIANEYDVHVRVGSPNAGHTIWWNGAKHVMQSIPCGWINPNAKIVIGRGALLNMKQLTKEILHILKYYPDFLNRLYIDPKAGVLDERFHQAEGGVNGEMHKRIGSTGEGVGPARMARLERNPETFYLFEDIAKDYELDQCLCPDTPARIAVAQDAGKNILIEGTQGSALSLLHSYWPYCTSIDTNAAGIISEVGIAPSRVTDVIMVCRTYPIRVAGNSGPMENEITWEQLSIKTGHNMVPEKTTVTKKVRRIAEWDKTLFERSKLLNAPTEIALTFVDYIDDGLYGTLDVDRLKQSESFMKFIRQNGLDNELLRYVSTGPDTAIYIQEGTKWE